MHPSPSTLKFWLRPICHLMLFALGLVCYKLISLEEVSRTYLNCQWCLSAKALPYEVQSFLLLVSLHFLSVEIRWYPLRLVLRLMVVGVLVITCLDLVVTREFWVRLTAQELYEYGSQIGTIEKFLQQALSSTWAGQAAIFALLLTLIIFIRYLKHDYVRAKPLFVYLLVGLGVYGCSWVEVNEYHETFLKSSIQAFFSPQTNNRSYSEEFKKGIPAKPSNGQACFAGQGARNDVILVVFESLSMYHSALFSGINDWMPEFDAASKTGLRLSHFYANGVSSEQGLVSLLTGEPPIAKGIEGSVTILEQFRNPAQTVPRMLHDQGYDTAFLTTGNLGFLRKGSWLKDIGFDLAEGHDASYYKGMKRYQFDAAPDDALYGRALLELQQHRERPLFLTLETVTTHLPNIDPESGAQSQELTYRYADRQLGRFVRDLRARGFFEHGDLIITADHRAMVPLSNEERIRYGDRAYVRIPMTVMGAGIRSGEDAGSYSQADLLPSLHHWLGKDSGCVGANQGIFLPTAVHTPQCIYTNRSYNVNDVFIHCGKEDFEVNLNGDKTQYVGAAPTAPDLLNETHRLRLGKGF